MKDLAQVRRENDVLKEELLLIKQHLHNDLKEYGEMNELLRKTSGKIDYAITDDFKAISRIEDKLKEVI